MGRARQRPPTGRRGRGFLSVQPRAPVHDHVNRRDAFVIGANGGEKSAAMPRRGVGVRRWCQERGRLDKGRRIEQIARVAEHDIERAYDARVWGHPNPPHGSIEGDIGRPLAHVAARVNYPDLQADARKVLKTLESTQREVRGADGEQHYIARILPYRSIDNFIAGAVVTFVDVTALTRAEERQKLLVAELQHRAMMPERIEF